MAMKLAQLSGFAAVIALMLLSGTPSFARGGGHGGGHGGHGGHAHAAVHHGGNTHHFANHAHAVGGHSGLNHSYAHNHAGWNHNAVGYGRGRGFGYGLGYGWGRGWGRAGWWGRGYGRWGLGYWSGPGLGYAVAGAIDPSFYYQYFNNVLGSAIPVTGK
jgi:hypothetical protein